MRTAAIIATSRFPFPQSLQKSGNSDREAHRLSRFRDHQTACSCLSAPATRPSDRVPDRPPADARPANDAGTSLRLERVCQSYVAATALAGDEHLPVWKVLAIFIAALVFASIAIRAVFRTSKVLPI
jgi:hypothetical protein